MRALSASASAVHPRESAATRSASSGGRRQYLRTLARLGYAAHGVVYGLVGVLALDAAVRGGSAEGGREAVAILGGGVIGSILLSALAAGLVLYSMLRGWQVIEPERPDAKGIARRVGHLVSVIIHLGLAFYALSLAFGWFVGNGGGGGGGGEQNVVDITGYVMRWPGGRFVIAGVGIGVLIAALWHLKNAVKADFMDELEVGEKSRWVRPVGQAGFAARFVVFLVVGGFLLIAAWQAEPEEARGLGGALQTVQQQMFGRILLGVVALGLLAFAATRMVQARYKADVTG